MNKVADEEALPRHPHEREVLHVLPCTPVREALRGGGGESVPTDPREGRTELLRGEGHVWVGLLRPHHEQHRGEGGEEGAYKVGGGGGEDEETEQAPQHLMPPP